MARRIGEKPPPPGMDPSASTSTTHQAPLPLTLGNATCSPSSAFSAIGRSTTKKVAGKGTPANGQQVGGNSSKGKAKGKGAAAAAAAALKQANSTAVSTSTSTLTTGPASSAPAAAAFRDPHSWMMIGELAAPPGLQEYEHCRTAARTFGLMAAHLRRTGELQHGKTLHIISTWDTYAYTHRVDISCGATGALLRVLADLPPEHTVPVPQQAPQFNPSLMERPLDELLDPTLMPAYVATLQEGGMAAVSGFVYANGIFRLWADDNFAGEYFDAEEANQRFQELAILPCYLYGGILAPEFRNQFYELLVKYLLTESNLNTTMSMVADTVCRDGRVASKLLRVRYMVLNRGQYACLALNVLPLRSNPSPQPTLLPSLALTVQSQMPSVQQPHQAMLMSSAAGHQGFLQQQQQGGSSAPTAGAAATNKPGLPAAPAMAAQPQPQPQPQPQKQPEKRPGKRRSPGTAGNAEKGKGKGKAARAKTQATAASATVATAAAPQQQPPPPPQHQQQAAAAASLGAAMPMAPSSSASFVQHALLPQAHQPPPLVRPKAFMVMVPGVKPTPSASQLQQQHQEFVARQTQEDRLRQQQQQARRQPLQQQPNPPAPAQSASRSYQQQQPEPQQQQQQQLPSQRQAHQPPQQQQPHRSSQQQQQQHKYGEEQYVDPWMCPRGEHLGEEEDINNVSASSCGSASSSGATTAASSGSSSDGHDYHSYPHTTSAPYHNSSPRKMTASAFTATSGPSSTSSSSSHGSLHQGSTRHQDHHQHHQPQPRQEQLQQKQQLSDDMDLHLYDENGDEDGFGTEGQGMALGEALSELNALFSEDQPTADQEEGQTAAGHGGQQAQSAQAFYD